MVSWICSQRRDDENSACDHNAWSLCCDARAVHKYKDELIYSSSRASSSHASAHHAVPDRPSHPRQSKGRHAQSAHKTAAICRPLCYLACLLALFKESNIEPWQWRHANDSWRQFSKAETGIRIWATRQAPDLAESDQCTEGVPSVQFHVRETILAISRAPLAGGDSALLPQLYLPRQEARWRAWRLREDKGSDSILAGSARQRWRSP